MYDPETSKLIQRAPSLEELDVDSLPMQLTKAFADIISTRIRLRGQVSDEELSSMLSMLRRIAATYEVYAAVLPEEHEQRTSAAFVSATAYQVASIIRNECDSDSYIKESEISSDICAALMFMLAGAHADAAEMAMKIKKGDQKSEIESQLILSIQHLAAGNIFEVCKMRTPDIDVSDGISYDLALEGLLLFILRGTIDLAQRIYEGNDRVLTRSKFHVVRDLSIESVDNVTTDLEESLSLFAGPLHLSTLLIGIEKELTKSSVTRVPKPTNTDSDKWHKFLLEVSKYRPYLWKNHRDVIQDDYLEKGVSSTISFPTGAGKSALSQLKIATAVFRNEQVIYLAPTRALVAQVRRELNDIFGEYDVISNVEEDVNFVTDIGLGDISVMTPECCLLMISMAPEEFNKVGLVVFDECHILHQEIGVRNRRSLDSMLAILNLAIQSPGTDFLLISAMMQNAEEVASWVSYMTNRRCHYYDLVWKPTRQVRGCIVYQNSEIFDLENLLSNRRLQVSNQRSIPDNVRQELHAQPYAFLSLHQNWLSDKAEDYEIFRILEDRCLLSATVQSSRWKLTPNRNVISRSIAESSAIAGLKTLVFSQSIRECNSSARDTSVAGDENSVIRLSTDEHKLYTDTVSEMGGAEYCYLALNEDGTLQSDAIVHHALLIGKERELHESIFKRRDGVKVMFATSTLAQGMNLPCDIVILSSDSRYDEGEGNVERDIHDLLNAAGRAGRAGQSAHGVVLLVPSQVTCFSDQYISSTEQLNRLKKIFKDTDQCVKITDPLQSLLDDIQNDTANDEDLKYLLSKLHLSSRQSETIVARNILYKSLCAYKALRRGDLNWIESRVNTVIRLCPESDLEDSEAWIGQVSNATGLTIAILRQIMKLFDDNKLSGNPIEIVYNLLDWLEMYPDSLMTVMRPSNLAKMCGNTYKNATTEKMKAKIATDDIRRFLKLWMTGRPLCEIEEKVVNQRKDGMCRNARVFSLSIVPDFSFVASIPGYLLSTKLRFQDSTKEASVTLKNLGQMVREGCDCPEALVVRNHLGRSNSRVEDYEHYQAIRPYIQVGASDEAFLDTIGRVRNAQLAYTFRPPSQR